jgi:beta-glucosidase
MNNSTLNTDLRERMGFKGYVLSDWGGTSSMAIQYGMEQEMDGNPANVLYTEAAVALVPNATLDTAVERIMHSWF